MTKNTCCFYNTCQCHSYIGWDQCESFVEITSKNKENYEMEHPFRYNWKSISIFYPKKHKSWWDLIVCLNINTIQCSKFTLKSMCELVKRVRLFIDLLQVLHLNSDLDNSNDNLYDLQLLTGSNSQKMSLELEVSTYDRAHITLLRLQSHLQTVSHFNIISHPVDNVINLESHTQSKGYTSICLLPFVPSMLVGVLSKEFLYIVLTYMHW